MFFLPQNHETSKCKQSFCICTDREFADWRRGHHAKMRTRVQRFSNSRGSNQAQCFFFLLSRSSAHFWAEIEWPHPFQVTTSECRLVISTLEKCTNSVPLFWRTSTPLTTSRTTKQFIIWTMFVRVQESFSASWIAFLTISRNFQMWGSVFLLRFTCAHEGDADWPRALAFQFE